MGWDGRWVAVRTTQSRALEVAVTLRSVELVALVQIRIMKQTYCEFPCTARSTGMAHGLPCIWWCHAPAVQASAMQLCKVTDRRK